MVRVHVAPSSTANGSLEVYGAPEVYGGMSMCMALSVVPSEQLRLQPISFGNDPLEQVIVENMISGEGGGGEGSGEGGGEGGGGEGGGEGGGGEGPLAGRIW